VLHAIGNPNPNNYYYRPTALHLGPHFFPQKEAPEAADLNGEFQHLKNVVAAAGDNTEQILLALEIHGSTLAAHPKHPDTSLFDYVRLTAGIADCLEKSNRLRLIGCRVAGIQSYLYDIVSKKASKNLKGRSFYIQLVVDSILLTLRKELDASACQVVYSSGGAFALLVPDTQEVDNLLSKLKDRLTRSLYRDFQTKLFIELAASVAFEPGKLASETWTQVNEELQKQRRSRLSSLLNNEIEFDSLFDPQDVGGTQARDAITNEEFNEEEQEHYEAIFNKGQLNGKSINFLDWTDDDKPILETAVKNATMQQVNLGGALAKAECWQLSEKPLATGLEINVLNLPGIFHSFPDYKPLNTTAKLIFMNEINGKYPFVLYGGNKVPEKVDPKTGREIPKTFDDLADCDGSLKRLGFLRMDLDNLGSLIKNHPSSFARFSTMSRHLDWFFRGYLNTLREANKFKNHLVILYSGGDDLFILGRWEKTLEFATLIHDEFKNWVCGNPNLTISGGLAVVPHKFPVIQAANMAKEAEASAKDLKGKDGFCLFGIPLKWNTEVMLVRKLKTILSEALEKEHINSSFLQKVQTHAESQKDQEKNQKTPRWRWITAYDFAQYARQGRHKEHRKELVDKLKDACFSDRYDNEQYKFFLQLLGIAARWLEMENRTLKTTAPVLEDRE